MVYYMMLNEEEEDVCLWHTGPIPSGVEVHACQGEAGPAAALWQLQLLSR